MQCALSIVYGLYTLYTITSLGFLLCLVIQLLWASASGLLWTKKPRMLKRRHLVLYLLLLINFWLYCSSFLLMSAVLIEDKYIRVSGHCHIYIHNSTFNNILKIKFCSFLIAGWFRIHRHWAGGVSDTIHGTRKVSWAGNFWMVDIGIKAWF